jgi:hypothetical protein
MKIEDGRPEFAQWVDRHVVPPNWKLLPLTHITRGVTADDILRTGTVQPNECSILKGSYAFFFYGRPAYRVGNSNVVKLEVSCPYCFIFNPKLLKRANKFFAFDTGAFGNRLFSHVVDDDFDVNDFSLSNEPERLNKLVKASFNNQNDYLRGDRTTVRSPSEAAQPHEHAARTYLELLKSPGRNEPDDRVCSLEIVFADPVRLEGDLLAIVAPHTVCESAESNPLLVDMIKAGVELVPYDFIPNRHPEHYHTLLELRVIDYYRGRGMI